MLLLLQGYAAPRFVPLMTTIMRRQVDEDWLWLVAAAVLELEEYDR